MTGSWAFALGLVPDALAAEIGRLMATKEVAAAKTVVLIGFGLGAFLVVSIERLPRARRVVVLLDSTTVAQNVRSFAELLVDILVERSVARDAVPVMVVCNKQDSLLAHSAEKARSLVEKEIDSIRATRSAGVDSQDADTGAADEYLGVEGEPFSFDQIPNKVEFIEVSLLAVAHHVAASGGASADAAGHGLDVSDDDEDATASAFASLMAFILP
ncbi:hypothetical protein HK405_001781 [Cladochytrium tenue]|nr:hypothetical protein HK405_001781 [Cladochytrium tenue]